MKNNDFSQWLINTRRYFHQHPELAFEEHHTTDIIQQILKKLNIDVHRFGHMTGLVGLIKGVHDGPTIALRADMDALPIQEMNNCAYKSSKESVMHACGHDAHMTVMLGVARKIIDTNLISQMHGNVKFLFQPAEEKGAGAKAMIDAGVLEDPYVGRILACHMTPDLPVGKVGIFKKSAGYVAADHFDLIIKGKGGHGGRPEECSDPIVAGAYFVTQVQSLVSRNVKPSETAIITIGKFASGDAGNVIPEYARLQGNIRYHSISVKEILWQRLNEIATGLNKTFDVTTNLDLRDGVPALVNDEAVSASLYSVSSGIIGKKNTVHIPAITGAEDFAFFTQERPSAIIRIGCSNEKKGISDILHSPYFDIDDTALEIGVNIFYEAVRNYLEAISK